MGGRVANAGTLDSRGATLSRWVCYPHIMDTGHKAPRGETNTMMTLTSRRGRTVAALAVALILSGTAAEARVGGGGGGFGSRGMRTYTPPPATRTAPDLGSPIQ